MNAPDMAHTFWNLREAARFYRLLGFKEVEVPWMVPERHCIATMPPGSRLANVNSDPDLSLVGSAEQGLLAVRFTLKEGIHMAFSPCFRLGDDDGGLHRETFLKIELGSSNVADWKRMMDAARTFFANMTDGGDVVDRQVGETQWDLEINGIEVGSYGFRPELCWAYGTGLAEPRFTMARYAPPRMTKV